MLDETGLESAAANIQRLADIRYVGQASELVVPLPPGPYTPASEPELVAAFEASYVAAFTRTPPSTPVEIINVRVTATLEVPGSAASMAAQPHAESTAIKGSRPAYFPEHGRHVATTVYDRYALASGNAYAGPAIIEERESTLIVGPSGRFEVAPSGSLIVTIA